MIEEDDDLPVLTQVLRIGSGRAVPAQPQATTEGSEESSIDEILLPDQLVIGTEPRRDLEPYVPLTTPLVDSSAHDGEPLVRSSPSRAQSLMVAFAESVDAPLPPSEAATSDEPESSDLDSAVHDVAPDVALEVASPPSPTEPEAERDALPREETADESRDAANDAATDAATKASAAIETESASGSESAPADVSTAVPTPESFDLDAFAVRIREAVLNDISARIDTELDARIAQSMHAELETALASLQAKLREHLACAMRDVVRRAVDEEIGRLRETRNVMPRE